MIRLSRSIAASLHNGPIQLQIRHTAIQLFPATIELFPATIEQWWLWFLRPLLNPWLLIGESR